MFLGSGLFLLIRMTMADRREAQKKRQALVDASQKNPSSQAVTISNSPTLTAGLFP
jgi:hypothetical protein